MGINSTRGSQVIGSPNRKSLFATLRPVLLVLIALVVGTGVGFVTSSDKSLSQITWEIRSRIGGDKTATETPGHWGIYQGAGDDQHLSPEQAEEIKRLRSLGYAGGTVPAQSGSGVTAHHTEMASRGLRFFTSGHEPGAYLMDPQGKILHTWRLTYDDCIRASGNPATDFMDARQNYWDDPAGPTHFSNPGGAGASVGDGVMFDPWLTDQAAPMTDVPDGGPALAITLHQNSPNPFNPMTTIAFDLPRPQDVRLMVYSLSGLQVATLFKGPLAAGHHDVIWRGRDDTGRVVASGTYFYRLEAGHYSETRMMVLVK